MSLVGAKAFNLAGLTYCKREAAVENSFALDEEPDLLRNRAKDMPAYLFRAKNHEDVFLEAQQNLHELNNILVLMRDSLLLERKRELSSEEAFAEITRSNEDTYDRYEAFVDSEEINVDARDLMLYDIEYGLHMTAYKNVGEIYAPASGLTLIYATLIRTMISVGLFYDKPGFKRARTSFNYKQGKAESEFTQICYALEKISGGDAIQSLRTRRVQREIHDKARRIRNQFLHGDWGEMQKSLVGVDIANCFDLVRVILEDLESIFTIDNFSETCPVKKVTRRSK